MLLEVVEIGEGDAQGPLVPRRVLEFARQELVQVGAVVDAGQRVAARLFLEFERLRRARSRPPARSVLISRSACRLRSISTSRACSRIEFRMLLGQQLGLEDRLGLRNHRADRSEDLAEGHLSSPRLRSAHERGLGELTLLRIEQEQIGDRTGERDAAIEDLGRIGRSELRSNRWLCSIARYRRSGRFQVRISQPPTSA